MAKQKKRTNCPVVQTNNILGARWTALILRDFLLDGSLRFQDLMDSLENIAPTTLSDRLKTLEREGIIERQFYSQHPPRAQYHLTQKGQELAPIIEAMRTWGQKYQSGSLKDI